MLFYLSHSKRSVTVVGVAEETLVSRDAEEIASTVGKRTVYSIRQIEEFCSSGEVLAILFRQAMRVEPKPVTLAELMQYGVLRAPPQSIVTVQQGGSEWLRQRLGL